MNEERDRYEEEETDSDDDSTWNDGLTDREIQNVVHFLRAIAQNQATDEEEECISEEEEEDGSATSMTTTHTTCISSDSSTTDEDFSQNHTDQDDYSQDGNIEQGNLSFYLQSQ